MKIIIELNEENANPFFAVFSKDDYKNDIHEIKGMLGKIFDKLEGKADKV